MRPSPLDHRLLPTICSLPFASKTIQKSLRTLNDVINRRNPTIRPANTILSEPPPPPAQLYRWGDRTDHQIPSNGRQTPSPLAPSSLTTPLASLAIKNYLSTFWGFGRRDKTPKFDRPTRLRNLKRTPPPCPPSRSSRFRLRDRTGSSPSSNSLGRYLVRFRFISMCSSPSSPTLSSLPPPSAPLSTLTGFYILVRFFLFASRIFRRVLV